MVFNSVVFGVFLVLVLVLYWGAQPRLRNAVLLVASYVFYGWWDWRFLGLLLISTIVDYTLGLRLHASDDDKVRRRLLLASMTVNLGILGVFKYFNFFIDSAASMLESLGVESNPTTLSIVLPVGISFYTFQTMSYTLDIQRRRLEPTRNIIAFATYVAYFPQLVAGPIERAQRLLPQIINTDRHIPDKPTRRMAVRLILMGLVKKVVIADGVAHIANDAFAGASSASWLLLLAGVVAFAIQIYGDFSGYTDIARGVSLLLGIDLIVNFTQPYLSRNITEFWRRWHISLSNWLRDYLYISLGGNRKGVMKQYRNLMLTMLLGGLWHGASWNFVIWGGLHGLYLVVHKLTRGGDAPSHEPRLRDLPAIATTFAVTLFAWIFFRAATFTESWDFIVGIFTFRSGPVELFDVATVALWAVAVGFLDLWERRAAVRPPRIGRPAVPRALVDGATISAALVAIVLFSGGTPVPFIYFQF